jgi:hypothetical protein
VRAGHLAESVAVHTPLIAREGEIIAREAVLDDHLIKYTDALAVPCQAPPDVDVLTGAEDFVEAVLEKLVPREHGRHESEPIAAQPRTVVHGQRATPIARTTCALQARLQSDIVSRSVLVRERLQRAVDKHDISVDERDTVLLDRAGSQHPGSRQPCPIVGDNGGAVPQGDLNGRIR